MIRSSFLLFSHSTNLLFETLCFDFNYFPHQAETDFKKLLAFENFSEAPILTFNIFLDFCPWLLC